MAILEIQDSARKHGVPDSDIEYAVLHAVGVEDIADAGGRVNGVTKMFVGHPHKGCLDDDWLEVGVAMWRDGSLHAFHAKRLGDLFRHLLYEDTRR